MFPRQRLVIFCDGDFWHGRDWTRRKERLKRGANPDYWISKINRNIERDLTNQARLEEHGWRVFRFWESEILKDGRALLAEIESALDGLDDT